ncbi:MAG: hypothetical protein M0C28_32985 [Candidatus Moduliflexus flocculans]|nr:hypothetical protein [Candidatus Moduliflexus flocculans]
METTRERTCVEVSCSVLLRVTVLAWPGAPGEPPGRYPGRPGASRSGRRSTTAGSRPASKSSCPSSCGGRSSTCGCVICREYNEDPVYLSLVPFAGLSARRLTHSGLFRQGRGQGRRRFSVSRYGIGGLFPTVWKAGEEDQWQALAKAVKERGPKRIGINESDVFAFGDGLSCLLRRSCVVQALGPEYSKRLRRRRAAGRWLARAAAARGDGGLPPHLRHRPRHHRRGVLRTRHHAGGDDDRRRRVVDLGSGPRRSA